jgi:TetR/AcrR family transcriptional regulator, tetracycline repressor protein
VTRHRRERPLTRDELLDAALGIVDSEGLAALTMRRLAAAVGVEAMTLYYHVPHKEALLDGTVERMRSEMRLPETAPDDWADALEAVFVEYRRVLAAHPNMLPLATRRTDRAEASGLQYLIDRGVAPDDAVELYQSLVAFTVGYSVLSSPLVETAWAGLPEALGERLREWRDATFCRTLRIVMDGYRAGKGAT